MQKQLKAALFSKRLWSITILILFALFASFYVSNNWAEFTSLKLEKPGFIVLLVVMSVISLFSIGKSMDAVLRPLGLRLSGFETFGLSAITRMGNYAPGRMGIAVRATYLKRKYKLPLTHFASTLAAAHILTYFISSTLGLISIILLPQYSIYTPKILPFALLLIGAIVVLACLLLFSPEVKERDNRLFNHFAKAMNGWRIIRHDQSALLKASMWIVVKITSQTLVIFAAFNSFGAELSTIQALFITSVNIFGAVIGITPGGLGISEGLVVGAASAVGVPISLALSAALLRRVATFMVAFVATLFASPMLFGKSIFLMFGYKKKSTES